MRQLLTKYCYTFDEAANLCRLSVETIKKWCKCNHKFTEKEINIIARAFGIEHTEVKEYVE